LHCNNFTLLWFARNDYREQIVRDIILILVLELDKERTSYSNSLDALTLAAKMYKMK